MTKEPKFDCIGKNSGITRVNNIPPLDLTKQYQHIQAEVEQSVLEVLSSGRYIGGETVATFEQQFADYIGTSQCVSCNSGTDALYLALRALNIGPGDEVITTPFTFIATAEVLSLAGATPVFVDIDETFNLDVTQVEAAITAKTKAIIPVHLFGRPVAMTQLMAIARAYNLYVIEDCAQATGATWDNQKVGSIGHVGCFSFFPTKNLGGCGDGGAVTTNDPAIAAHIRMLKEHGSKVRYLHEEIGVNSRLDALQAAILSIKLRHLDLWNQGRDRVAATYRQLLQLLPDAIAPSDTTGGQSVWNQYTIRARVGGQTNAQARDRVRSQLQELGISSMVYYPIPLHLQPVYHSLGYQVGQLPQAEQAANEVLSLPMFPELTYEQQERVVYGLKDCLLAKIAS
jgi:dTDP-4-amino-4,6-dideoxygalactose transaminase